MMLTKHYARVIHVKPHNFEEACDMLGLDPVTRKSQIPDDEDLGIDPWDVLEQYRPKDKPAGPQKPRTEVEDEDEMDAQIKFLEKLLELEGGEGKFDDAEEAMTLVDYLRDVSGNKEAHVKTGGWCM